MEQIKANSNKQDFKKMEFKRFTLNRHRELE